MTSRSCAAARPAQICRAISRRAVFREAADALEQRREILAVHVLHRQERRAVDFVDVVDAADVGVRDLPRHADFGVELGQARRILVDVGRQELERDRLAELQVVGAIHLAHAAAAQALDDAVASAEQRARLEAAVIDGARRREPAGGGRGARIFRAARAIGVRLLGPGARRRHSSSWSEPASHRPCPADPRHHGVDLRLRQWRPALGADSPASCGTMTAAHVGHEMMLDTVQPNYMATGSRRVSRAGGVVRRAADRRVIRRSRSRRVRTR